MALWCKVVQDLNKLYGYQSMKAFTITCIPAEDIETSQYSRATILPWLWMVCVITNSTVFNIHFCHHFMCTTVVSIIFYTLIVFFACAVPNTAIFISTTAVSTPSLGQSLSIRCIVTETVDGLSARPVLQWLNHNGSDIVSGGGVILDGPNSQSILTTLTLMFSALRTSHAGRYICQGSLTSPTLFSPLVKAKDHNISVQSKSGSYACVHTS